MFLCIPVLRGCTYGSTANSKFWALSLRFCLLTCFHVRIPKPCGQNTVIEHHRDHHCCHCPSVNIPEKKKSPWLRQYQSYISNWYINGKVFTSTTAWKPKNLIFSSSKNEFWHVPKNKTEITLASSISVLHW